MLDRPGPAGRAGRPRPGPPARPGRKQHPLPPLLEHHDEAALSRHIWTWKVRRYDIIVYTLISYFYLWYHRSLIFTTYNLNIAAGVVQQYDIMYDFQSSSHMKPQLWYHSVVLCYHHDRYDIIYLRYNTSGYNIIELWNWLWYHIYDNNDIKYLWNL